MDGGALPQICYTKFSGYATDGHLMETVVDLQNRLEVRGQDLHVNLPINSRTNSSWNAHSSFSLSN